MNKVFGYQIPTEGAFWNNVVFDGTLPVSLPPGPDKKMCNLRVFAHPDSNLTTCVSEKHGLNSYVLGIPVHPDITLKAIPEWCAEIIAGRRYEHFRELLGSFVVIVDDPSKNRITFVTDIIGLRPFFIGKNNGCIVFGTDVWTLYQAGLCDAAIDYDAVSEWISYGYSVGNRSLFSNLSRLSPGTVSIFQDDGYNEIPYTEFQHRAHTPSLVQVAEEIYDIVASNVKTLLAFQPQISIALSGGYDSRFLLALCSSLTKATINCGTVSFSNAEGYAATQVADLFGLPLKIFPVKRSIWDIYDNVYHFTPNGFPITKFVTYCIAEEYPEIPMVNGFVGDVLIRGVNDKILGKYETEWKEDLADVLQRRHFLYSFETIRKLLRKDIFERIRMRSRPSMEKAVRNASNIGKAFNWADIYYRQRHFISNNFLQHIEITEAIIPFYSWSLLSYKMEHENKVFSRNLYQKIFEMHSPELAKIPHADDLTSHKKTFRVARCTKQWAKQLLPVLFKKKYLSLLQKGICISLDAAGFTGLRQAERAIFLFKRLYLLEKKVKQAGIDFDWDRI